MVSQVANLWSQLRHSDMKKGNSEMAGGMRIHGRIVSREWLIDG
jgi:hypothetical protein